MARVPLARPVPGVRVLTFHLFTNAERSPEGATSMPTTQENQEQIRIGVDLGGTKIEFVALERDGRELHRHRMATPRFDYEGTVRALTDSVTEIAKEIGRSASVGLGIPGTISTKTGLVKNANSTWMNGKPFDKDVSRALGREV